MADTVILAETKYEGFVDGQLQIAPAPFTLAAGEKYTVVWDGVEHECECVLMDGSPVVTDVVPDESGEAILEGTFAIIYGSSEAVGADYDVVMLMAYDVSEGMLDTDTEHTVAIYQGAEEDADDMEYLIKGSTLTAIADAIRAKTGKADAIPVPDMPSEIAGITAGGGGSSADVRYVTFMSYDGSVEYGKKAVAVGDDCADPIARGLFSTPTRESTAQYSYAFYGWATTPNGGADANWYMSITEDKTVYANFASAVRYYTITYYDGETILKTESLAYGVTPEYTVVKAGYNFLGWSPKLTSVVGNADYYAQWEEINGFSSVLTMAEADLPTSASGLKYGKVAINNAGTLLALAFGSRQASGTAPNIYNIIGDAPAKLSGPAIGVASNIAFNYDDTKLVVEGYNTSDYKHYIAELSIDDLTSCSASGKISNTLSNANIACSPVADMYGYPRQISGTNYSFVQSNDASIAFGNTISYAAYSPDGEHVALVGSSTVGAKIYNINGELVADASKFTSKYVNKVSYNSDGSLLAVSYSAAPWLEVYETTNYTKVCDLSDIVSASSFAEFMGVDTLVVGTGTSVVVRTITETGHKAFEYNVPEYEESGDIVNIVKNHNGTRVVIQSTAKATVWALM